MRHRRAAAVFLVPLVLMTAGCPGPPDDDSADSSLGPFHPPAPGGLFPEPELCKSESPRYAKLDERKPATSDLGVAYRVTAVNERGQTFEITYTGSSADSVNAYLDSNNEAKTCLEAQVVQDRPEDEPPLPALETSVVDIVVQESGESRDEVAEYRDQELQNSPTLKKVAQHFGVAETTVIAGAKSTASTTFSEVDQETTEAAVDEILGQDDAPALVRDWEQPRSDNQYATLLSETDAVLVQVDVVDPRIEVPKSDDSDGGVISISYIFDPKVDAGGHVYYKARCEHDAWVRLHATAGRMSVYLWRRDPYLDIGSRYASTSSYADPGGLWHSSKQERAYDILVRGWENESSYRLDGAWNVGWGGGC